MSSYQTFESNGNQHYHAISSDSIIKNNDNSNDHVMQVESINERLCRIKLELTDVLEDINILEKTDESSILTDLELQTKELLNKTNIYKERSKPFATFAASSSSAISSAKTLLNGNDII